MDAAYIDRQMALSPLYGDPDEDRDFTAADLDPKPEQQPEKEAA